MWKEAFEKAKKIVESDCEAYSGKPDAVDSDSEISCSDSEDDLKSKVPVKEIDSTKLAKDTEVKSTDEVTKNLEKLKVKEQE